MLIWKGKKIWKKCTRIHTNRCVPFEGGISLPPALIWHNGLAKLQITTSSCFPDFKRGKLRQQVLKCLCVCVCVRMCVCVCVTYSKELSVAGGSSWQSDRLRTSHCSGRLQAVERADRRWENTHWEDQNQPMVWWGICLLSVCFRSRGPMAANEGMGGTV